MENEELVELGLRIPESMNEIILKSVETLKRQGFSVSKSDLVRSVLSYRIENAVSVYKEVKREEEKRKKKEKPKPKAAK